MDHLLTSKELPANILETFLKCKDGTSPLCGDAICITKDYIAIIDGATPKGTRLWNGAKGDVFVSGLLKDGIAAMPPHLTAKEAIEYINALVCTEYEKIGLSCEELPPEEQLQASVVIYSADRKEIWRFGDCQFRINGEDHIEQRRGDALLADLRVFCMEAARLEGLTNDRDYGREAILPFLKSHMKFANTESEFGYDVINGGTIYSDHVKIVPVKKGDLVVLSSDGYPTLFDTLAETEAYLFKQLSKDPTCVDTLRSTKGVQKGYESFDDRSYVSFYVI